MKIPQLSNFSKLLGIFLVSCAALNSSAFADQLSIVYTDSSGTVQTLVIYTGSSDADLKRAASLMGESGVSLSVVSGGTDTIADIAGAMAYVSPNKGPDIIKALIALAPKEEDAIKISVNDAVDKAKKKAADDAGGDTISDTPLTDDKSVSPT